MVFCTPIQTRIFYFFLQAAFLYLLPASAQSSLQVPLTPLAVKTPYLNAWIGSANDTSPADTWPIYFLDGRILGWAGLVRVDNQTFQWMGKLGSNSTKTVASTITPTKSVFRLEAGPVQFNATFFTPIEPNDYARQSIPFSYLYLDAFSANDSLAHTIQVYSDVTAEWVTADLLTQVKWDTGEDQDMIYHHFTQQNTRSMGDNGNTAEDGQLYYASQKRPGLTWRSGSSAECRKRFSQNGILEDTMDNDFRAVNARGWPAVSFAVDLGTVSPGDQPEPVVWALGLVRDPLIAFKTPSESRVGYFWSSYNSIDSVITDFLSDFKSALNRSAQLDNQIISAATVISPEYAGILAFITRQLFASMDITIPPRDLSGNFNTSDVKIFMKDMGASNRTNPVDVIYSALPALLYFNSSIVAHLLEPLFELQSSSPYAAPDLGNTYPTVRGNTTDTSAFAVESCGNMLIVTYAHAIKSGDGSLLLRYQPTLQRWADYLVTNALNPPPGSMTMDGLEDIGVSNLALKGIIGVYSMGKINEALGILDNTYQDQATQLIEKWRLLAVTNNHIQYNYQNPNSWGLVYDLFPAIWLNTSLIDDDILIRQSEFYSQQPISKYGLAPEGGIVYPHWTLLTAATIPDNMTDIRNRFINPVNHRVNTMSQIYPLPIRYSASTGDVMYGASGSPIHGAAYGLLSLGLKNVNIQMEPSPQPTSKKDKTGAIVGGVIGGLGGLLLIATSFFLWRRWSHSHGKRPDDGEKIKPYPFIPIASPRARDSIGVDNIGAESSSITQPLAPVSRKQREALNTGVHQPAPSVMSVTRSSSARISGDLRVEVEQLRRELADVRYLTDMPPGYT